MRPQTKRSRNISNWLLLIIWLILIAQTAFPAEYPFEKAKVQAVANGLPLVVMIGADWCEYCSKMKTTTLPQLSNQGDLKGFNFAYVDFDREEPLRKQLLTSEKIPQLIVFKREGDKLVRKADLAAETDPAKVKAFLQRNR